jgi:hypothetical protein
MFSVRNMREAARRELHQIRPAGRGSAPHDKLVSQIRIYGTISPNWCFALDYVLTHERRWSEIHHSYLLTCLLAYLLTWPRAKKGLSKETSMKRFGVLLASATLGAALLASGPAMAMGGSFGGGHGGFGGGHGGFGGGHMGGGFGGSHMGGGWGGGHMGGFAGRSVAMGGGGWGHNGWGHNGWGHHGWGRNNYGRYGYGYGGWGLGGLGLGYGLGLGLGLADWDYGYGYPSYGYGYGYPGYGYDNGYAYGYGYPGYSSYGYPATGSSGYYSSAAPLVTGRSVATGQMGRMCSTPVKSCELYQASWVGNGCSCKVPGGRSRGSVSP